MKHFLSYTIGDDFPLHSVFVNDDSAVRIEPSANTDAQTYVNGMLITTPTQLHHVRDKHNVSCNSYRSQAKPGHLFNVTFTIDIIYHVTQYVHV